MARMVLAGVVAGLVVFFWGAVAHMALPLGMAGMQFRPDADQQQVLSTLRERFDGGGIYLLPMPQPEQWQDEAAMTAFGQRSAQSPYAFVVYQPQGRDSTQMGANLAIQALGCILGAIIAACIAAQFAGRGRRILAVTLLGVFAWLAFLLPYWNWYRFPTGFAVAGLIEAVVGWLLAGIAIALLLRPRGG